MIQTKEDLTRYLRTEKKIYLGDSAAKHILVHTKNWIIYRYINHLRHEEYYKNNLNNWRNKILYCWYKRRKNILGQRLGFDIPANCFQEGLCIFHVGGVIVNQKAVVGKNCSIAGNVCIGANNTGVPTIGDDCRIGYGATVIGGITLGNSIKIGAGAVVNKDCLNDKSVLVGVPAKAINQ